MKFLSNSVILLISLFFLSSAAFAAIEVDLQQKIIAKEIELDTYFELLQKPFEVLNNPRLERIEYFKAKIETTLILKKMVISILLSPGFKEVLKKYENYDFIEEIDQVYLKNLVNKWLFDINKKKEFFLFECEFIYQDEFHENKKELKKYNKKRKKFIKSSIFNYREIIILNFAKFQVDEFVGARGFEVNWAVE